MFVINRSKCTVPYYSIAQNFASFGSFVSSVRDVCARQEAAQCHCTADHSFQRFSYAEFEFPELHR